MNFIDPDVKQTYIRLLDALCSWERTTGREITVVVIPHDVSPDEPVAISTSGKPWTGSDISDVLTAIGMALQARTP